jgi:hypothetical protein
VGLGRRRPSPAMVVALLALFVALAGSSYAALRVTGRNVANGSLTGADVRTNSVTGRDIRGLRSGDVTNGSLGGVDIADGSLTGSDVARDSLTGAEVIESTLGSFPPTGAAGGALSGTFPTPGIARGAVGATQLADGAVAPRHQAAVPAVRASGNPGVTVAHNTSTILPFTGTSSSLDVDTDNMHDPSGPTPERLTARTSGVYLVYTAVLWSPNATGLRELRVEHFPAAGGGESTVMSRIAPVSGEGTAQNALRIVRMQPGDHVRVTGRQTSGGNLDLHPVDFGAAWIGP